MLFGAVVVTRALELLGPDDDTALKAVVWGGIREIGPLVTVDLASDAKERTTSAVAEVKAAGESATGSVRDQARESAEHMRQDTGETNG